MINELLNHLVAFHFIFKENAVYFRNPKLYSKSCRAGTSILCSLFRAVDKRECMRKMYVVTPHLNSLNETFQMRGHKICFQGEVRKSIHHLWSNLELLV